MQMSSAYLIPLLQCCFESAGTIQKSDGDHSSCASLISKLELESAIIVN